MNNLVVNYQKKQKNANNNKKTETIQFSDVEFSQCDCTSGPTHDFHHWQRRFVYQACATCDLWICLFAGGRRVTGAVSTQICMTKSHRDDQRENTDGRHASVYTVKRPPHELLKPVFGFKMDCTIAGQCFRLSGWCSLLPLFLFV